MQSEQTVNGCKITQALQNSTTRNYYPSIISSQVVADRYYW